MKQRLLIEIDMLLDTRIATVATLDDEAAISLLSPEYRHRKSDELWLINKNINKDDYIKRYNSRDKLTLMGSRPTPLTFMLNKIIGDILNDQTGRPEFETLEIDINIWPFELDEYEKISFINCIVSYIGFMIPIKIVRYHPNELTFKRIAAEGWTGLFIYNFRTWAEAHIEKYDESDPKLASNSLVIPELLRTASETIPEDESKLPNGLKVTPFEALRILLSPIIAVRYLPVELVSIAELPEFKGENDGSKDQL